MCCASNDNSNDTFNDELSVLVDDLAVFSPNNSSTGFHLHYFVLFACQSCSSAGRSSRTSQIVSHLVRILLVTRLLIVFLYCWVAYPSRIRVASDSHPLPFRQTSVSHRPLKLWTTLDDLCTLFWSLCFSVSLIFSLGQLRNFLQARELHLNQPHVTRRSRLYLSPFT